jgi:hypothetical protein
VRCSAYLGAGGEPEPARSRWAYYRPTDAVARPIPRSQPGPWGMMAQSWYPSTSIFFLTMFLLIECSFSRRAEAELGPCTIAAPTTPNVIVFVSDIDRSVRWYRENAGLVEAPRSDFGESHGRVITVMTRNRAGVTLVSSYGASHSPRDSQMACFVLDGPPAPSPGSASLFLIDPDGTSIELPPSGQDRY